MLVWKLSLPSQAAVHPHRIFFPTPTDRRRQNPHASFSLPRRFSRVPRRLSEMSNCYCHPGKAGGTPRILGRRGAAVFVMDLIRPATQQAARDIVEAVAPREHPILKEDFYNSLCAAFTMEEVETQLRQARMLLEVDQVSDRHMLIKGALQ